MKQIFPLIFMAFFSCPTLIFSMHDAETTERNLNVLMSSTNPVLVPLQNAVLKLGKQVAAMNDNDLRHNSAQNIQDHLRKIEENILMIQTQSATLAQQDSVFSEDERRALRLLDQEIAGEEGEGRIASMLGITSAASIFMWIVQIDPITVFRASLMRFPGIDIAALATIKSLFGPIVCIICIAVAWYQFKQWIVEPYKRQHETDIAQFRTDLAAHRQQTQAAFDLAQRHFVATRGDLMTALQATKELTERELKTIHAADQQQVKALENNTRNMRVELQEREKFLLRHIEERMRKLQEQWDRDQKGHRELAQAFNDQVELSIENLQDSVGSLKEHNKQLKAVVDKNVVDLGQAQQSIRTVKEEAEHHLAEIRKTYQNIGQELQPIKNELGKMKTTMTDIENQVDSAVSASSKIADTVTTIRQLSEKLMLDMRAVRLSGSNAPSGLKLPPAEGKRN